MTHPILSILAPELVLVIAAVIVLLLGLSRSGVVRGAAGNLAVLATAVALYLVWSGRGAPAAWTASLQADALAWYARLITLATGLIILLVNQHVPADEERGEFFSLTLFSLAGLMLAAVADDLILLFLALELVSIPTYVLIAISRNHAGAHESAVKYFFLGSFAAALMLYGISFLYGVAGTTSMFHAADGGATLATSLPAAVSDPVALIGLLLVIAGLAFKMAVVPFHFYVADVYQGAASPVTGMLGFLPKFAGLVALVRLLSLAGWTMTPALFWLFWGLAAATMTVGNLLALMQNNAKRMLAYSSIAHSGYMLVALLAGPGLAGAAGDGPTRNGVTAALFYMAVYGLMNLGAFAALSYIRRADTGESIEDVDDLSGAATRHPAATLALAVCLLSLMGFPPTAGFLGKFYVFSSAFAAAGSSPHGAALIALVILAFVNTAVAAAYYLRLVATCYLRPEPAPTTATPCAALRVGLGLCAVAMLLLFALPGVLTRAAGPAGAVVRGTHQIEQLADDAGDPARAAAAPTGLRRE